MPVSDPNLGTVAAGHQDLSSLYRDVVRLPDRLANARQARRRNGPDGNDVMTWHEIDWNRRSWTMRERRTKSRRSHIIPLSQVALDLLTNARRFGGATYVFLSFRSGVERQLTPGAASDAFLPLIRHLGLRDVHLHDLRRSAATHIYQSDPAATREVVSRILNHGSGSRDVTSIYDRFDHSEAVRATLDRWSNYVLRQAGQPHPGVS